ncbi:hypothetical protein [Chryseobacterium sp. 5_R23647]|uniref:hypothetical protein n=1 Tax=Chryseobacterium sp. 5_R23647 TaxID=2258964 RepID=UPI000E2571BB|nr:hypothetical protein [Chryseobacterium sp. 5_R23647]REC41689.1 hypothetical protein DRF69_14220 [Chryseobacterium sp. 5_R23647]
MKKLFLLLLLIPLFLNAQLRLSNVYELYVIKSKDVENYVIKGLGFKRLDFKLNGDSSAFEFYNGKNNFEEAIYVKVLIPHIEKFKNVVTVRTANESYVQELKSEITSHGFEYKGEVLVDEKNKIHLYIKDNIIFSISSQKNNNGIYEINIAPKNK